MSERKSWDIQPKRRAASPPPVPAKPEPRPAPARPARQAARPQAERPRKPVAARPAPRPSPRRAPLPAGSLRERRNRRRRVARYVFLTILLLLAAGAFYLLWQPAFRIRSVSARGPGSDAAKQIAQADIVGTYFHIIPRNSVFFYPEKKVRAAILDAVPEAAAVSLQRDSFSSIQVTTVPREEAFLWCGTAIDTPNPDGCYDADVEGYIFKHADGTAAVRTGSSTASTTPQASTTAEPVSALPVKGTHDQVRVFAGLTTDLADGQSPIRAHIVSAKYLSNALKFVDAMRTLGAPVSALAIRGDEADLWLNGPTRITYVLGLEKQAADIAASALPTLNLTNGTIQYVDLRFPGKAYVKKYGE